MTGWTAVIVVTALIMVAMIGLNVRLYRRMRAAMREGARREADRSAASAPVSHAEDGASLRL